MSHHGDDRYRAPAPYALTDPVRAAAGPGHGRRRGLLVALVLVLALVVAFGVAGTFYGVSRDGGMDTATEEDPRGGSSGASPGSPTGAATTTPGGFSVAPENRIGMGPVVAQPGDCLVNDGSEAEPVMRIVRCDTDGNTVVYQVLERYQEAAAGDTEQERDLAAQEICSGIERYAHHYRLLVDEPGESFVLCMDEE